MNKKDSKKLLQIGEIAKKARTSVRTVRYYLEEGFIEAADRSRGGFYLFEPEAAETVFFVQKLKDAGLALKDIKKIYRARRDGKTGDKAYPEVLKHLETQKTLVEQKIADYQRLKTEIEEAIKLMRQCDGCRIKPCRQNCEACTVVTSRKKLPLPLKAIF
ncbi:MAG: MerR family transcriptional regulator [Desulfobacterales bacterium]|nr:MerR family transcriptional regulator [Desulfobacterales bacterium]